MNNLLDPVKILVCGGCEAGKTSILLRLADMEFPSTYEKTFGINVIECTAFLKHNATIKVTVIDIGANLVRTHGKTSLFSALVMNADGMLVVMNCINSHSISDTEQCIDRISKSMEKVISKHLLVHKADLLHKSGFYSTSAIEAFVAKTDMDDYALTVGHAELGDAVMNRGDFVHQKAPSEVLNKLVLAILLKRQSNFCKLVPVPFRIEFCKWTSYEVDELDEYISSQTF